ncbi:TPA: hypothetical protein ACTEL6_001729 [Legionella pneumophila]
MSIKPVKFSEHFGIGSTRLAELGVFDPILNHDTKLFTDPLLLKDSTNILMRDAFAIYKEFFANLMRLLKMSSRNGDRCWRAAKRMVHFPEYKYTCIGYGTGTINGAGSGSVLNEKILESAKEIISLATDDPSIFLLLPLLEEGIGPDIISDMTQNIIDDRICEYTHEIIKKLDIKGTRKHFSRANKLYSLPYNPYHKCVIKLLPLDVLTNIPLAKDFNSWVVDSTEENQALRSKVNELIGVTWLDATKEEKKETLLALLKNDKPFFLSVLGALQNETFKPYDLEKDFEGLYRWLEDSKVISEALNFERKNLDASAPLSETIGFIIQDFKALIEQQELWRLFWTEFNKKRKHVKEFYSQMLFFMVSSAWISGLGNKISVDRIYNKDSKQLEIIFTLPGQQKVKVQLKHSDNSSGLRKGYETQVSQCNRRKIQSYYVVLDFLDIRPKQLNYILANEDPLCKIVQIDAAFKQNEVSHDLSDDLFDIDFGDLTTEYFDLDDDNYLNEKRKGGENSYQAYEPLRKKVEELCLIEMENSSYSSARRLSYAVAQKIEDDFPDLLTSFQPYINGRRNGGDWRHPTFYNWCNSHFKLKNTACYENTHEEINE